MRALLYSGLAAVLALGSAPALAGQDTPPVPIRALDQRSLTLATEIIEIAYPSADRHAMLARTSNSFMTQAQAAAREMSGGERDEDMQRILDRFTERVRGIVDRQITDGAPALFTAMARAYARAFSYAELVEIRAFVGTPAGRAFMRRSSELLSDPDVARANTAYMAAAMAALQPLQAEFMEELRAWTRSHERHRSEPTSGT